MPNEIATLLASWNPSWENVQSRSRAGDFTAQLSPRTEKCTHLVEVSMGSLVTGIR